MQIPFNFNEERRLMEQALYHQRQQFSFKGGWVRFRSLGENDPSGVGERPDLPACRSRLALPGRLH